jgi:fructokinase
VKFKIVAIGEVLWDLLPDGKQLGGAPANFTYHAHALGADARLISCIGSDELGREILDRFGILDLPTSNLKELPGTPTGTVSVELARNGNPEYTIHEHVAWDQLRADQVALNLVRAADAVCFGSLAQRTVPAQAEVKKLVAAASAQALRIFDVNLRPPHVSREVIDQSLRLANVLKLNDHELEVVADFFGLPARTPARMEALARRYDLDVMALTRGEHGSLLWRAGNWSDLPGMRVVVRDSIGAGDAFTATLALGLLRELPLEQINRLANEVAAYVCSQPGGTPRLPERFREALADPEGQGSATG